jgi:hypothetical protein
MNINSSRIKKQAPVVLFLFFIIILGLSIFKDYGLGWDEGICIRNGVINAFEINKKLNYIIIPKQKVDVILNKSSYNDRISSLTDFQDKYYGSINEIILLIPSFLLKFQNDPQKVVLSRHMLIYLIFILSLIFFYKILDTRYKNWKISLLGCLFMILSPRIFADSFYNSKDMIFLPFVLISMFTSMNFIVKKTITSGFIHAILTGIVIAVRIPGLFVPFLTILFLLLTLIKDNQKIFNKKNMILIFSYIFFSLCFIYIFWPYLWDGNPFYRFIEAFLWMKKFYFTLDVLYWGNLVYPQSLPWHYLPVWILITTPILYSILFIFGFVFIFTNLYKNKFNKISLIEILDIHYFSFFIVPVIIIIILNSVLYNAWRQLFFVYPAFILTAILGLNKLNNLAKKNKYLKITLVSVVIISMGFTSFQMIKSHPYQMVYFNFIAGESPQKNFEYEYWGMSYKAGLEMLLQKNQNIDRIKVFITEFSPIKGSLRILDQKDASKIIFTDFTSAEYFVTNYTEFYNNKQNFFKRYHIKPEQEVDSIVVDENKILSIYKLNQNNFIDSSIKVPMLNDGSGRLTKKL